MPNLSPVSAYQSIRSPWLRRAFGLLMVGAALAAVIGLPLEAVGLAMLSNQPTHTVGQARPATEALNGLVVQNPTPPASPTATARLAPGPVPTHATPAPPTTAAAAAAPIRASAQAAAPVAAQPAAPTKPALPPSVPASSPSSGPYLLNSLGRLSQVCVLEYAPDAQAQRLPLAEREGVKPAWQLACYSPTGAKLGVLDIDHYCQERQDGKHANNPQEDNLDESQEPWLSYVCK
jgi:hypothetical protein